MKKTVFLWLLLFLGLYCACFMEQEQSFRQAYKPLQPLPTATFLQAASGYGRQVLAESLFIQSSVFLGGLPPGTDPDSYAGTLAHNFAQISALYPEFADTYYFAQSYLAHVAPERAREVNAILARGRTADPDNLAYPFFQAFNAFEYLGEPLKAAELFREASQLPNAPPMFAHLAVILSAEGGELEASLISLQALVRSSNDEGVRKRYEEEIAMLQQAQAVQQAVSAFAARHQRYPTTLDELVPEYFAALPQFGTAFALTYKPPRVGLIRPHRKKASAK